MKQIAKLYYQLKSRVFSYNSYKRWQNFKTELEDQKLNREYIGEDRVGNKYYQYYSYFGLPTKRQIEFVDKNNIHLRDLVYYDWLSNRTAFHPTEYEIAAFYEAESLRKVLGQKWDQEQRDMIEAVNQQRLKVFRQREEKNLTLQLKPSDTLLEILEQTPKVSEQKTQDSNNQETYEPQQWKQSRSRR